MSALSYIGGIDSRIYIGVAFKVESGANELYWISSIVPAHPVQILENSIAIKCILWRVIVAIKDVREYLCFFTIVLGSLPKEFEGLVVNKQACPWNVWQRSENLKKIRIISIIRGVKLRPAYLLQPVINSVNYMVRKAR